MRDAGEPHDIAGHDGVLGVHEHTRQRTAGGGGPELVHLVDGHVATQGRDEVGDRPVRYGGTASNRDASGLSPERQARLLVDVARAQGQRQHTGEATKAPLDAECLAPEHVRSHHLTHGMIRDLIDQLGRRAPTDLVELARRSGAMP